MSKQSVAAVVIGRAESRGLPGKNTLAVAGRPMVAHSVLDACRATGKFAEIVQLGATHLTACHDFDLVDARRVHREGTLDAHGVRHLADGERLADAAVLAADAYALEDLNTLFLALDDLDVNAQRIARLEVGDVATELLRLDCIDDVAGGHEYSPCESDRTGPEGAVVVPTL